MLLILLVLVISLAVLTMGPGHGGQMVWPEPGQEAADRGQPTSTIPDHLDGKVEGYFFSRSEGQVFRTLERTLSREYRVFPNVHLNDLFVITAPPQRRQATYAWRRDKHVDLLMVSLPGHCPGFAIELDGMSHGAATQQHQDKVKHIAFCNAGLPVLRPHPAEPGDDPETPPPGCTGGQAALALGLSGVMWRRPS
ncbi:DUF2726 domain-containing protein [Deinococcus aerolatus]|nr:DUF2726 domain-containing protein [Deinococcus aerolatus]